MNAEHAGEDALRSTIGWTYRTIKSMNNPICSPRIGADGRISLPGQATGLSLAAYRSLLKLYGGIVQADQLLQNHQKALSLSKDGWPLEALTPLQPSGKLPGLFYKREDTTVTRAYKVRGALVCMAKAMECYGQKRFLAVSTGNHALGVLKAAEILKPESVRIVVPSTTDAGKLSQLERNVASLKAAGLNASLQFGGPTFDDANAWALEQSQGDYVIDPRLDSWVVSGQGTIGLELLRQLSPLLDQYQPEEVAVISPVGGGGLLGGISAAMKMASMTDPRYQRVRLRLLGMRLADYTSELGDAIRVKHMGPGNQLLFEYLDVPLLAMTDEQMAEGLRWVHDDIGAAVEGPSGGTLYPVLHLPEWQPNPKRLVITIQSGGNIQPDRFLHYVPNADVHPEPVAS